MWTIIVEDVLSFFILGLIISIIPLVLTLFLRTQQLSFIMFLLGLIIANLYFAALSVLLSAYSPTDVPATSMILLSLVKFPLVFIPVELLPQRGSAIASISPSTYFTDIVRQLF